MSSTIPVLRTTIRCMCCGRVVSDQLQALNVVADDSDVGFEQLSDHSCAESVVKMHDGTHVAITRWKISYWLKRTP